MTSTGSPPILRPRWSRPSSNALRISLPIAEAGPLNVGMKPILTDFCCAIAGPAKSASAAVPAINGLIIACIPSLSSRSTRGLLPAELVQAVVVESSACLRNSTGGCHGVSGHAKCHWPLGQLREQLGENIGVIACGREQVAARLVDHRFEAHYVEPDHAAAIFAHPAADDDGLDIAALGRLHHGADGVVRRIEVDVVGADHEEIGFLARGT